MHQATFALSLFVGAVVAFQCSSFNTTISVSAPSYQPAFAPFANHYQSVALLNAVTARDASTGASPFKRAINVVETFSISAEYCTPTAYQHPAHLDVQILTHGLGFDKSYWKFGGDSSQYNYVRAATDAGYATLSYDRISNGGSTVVDPYIIQQAPMELAALEAITSRFRNGTIHSSVPKPSGKVFHVGHSYGSILSHALVASNPSLSDGIVLTGYSTNNTWVGEFLISTNFHLAKENQPQRFGNRSTGFVTWADELANQYIFLSYPHFDPAVLAYAETHKYPFSVSEVLTGGVVPYNAANFTKPVLMISGDADLIFCGSDCHGILEQAAPLFPAAKPFETYVQPDTGHGMNLHYNASGTYAVILDFLKRNT
ncbi:hypothetical protein B0A54_12329 [Friedmanniomyces endolithicus]|uniref:AB hydrolase-1 domain-containing protein n=1 Tax=Friedmanniomyces endolithicus TaxID=329885 RepID=A0A4U0UJL2_9PEZI|nr:hypothetical protein B0A54_12329 [Friedmanniomyces endolithicus]